LMVENLQPTVVGSQIGRVILVLSSIKVYASYFLAQNSGAQLLQNR